VPREEGDKCGKMTVVGKHDLFQKSKKKCYSFCLMVEASDHGYVLHTRRIHVTRYRINVSDGQLHRFAARERSVNGMEDFISKYYWSTFSLAVPDFAARISGVVDYVEAPGDESWNY
jgi:hypothetical protein